MTLSRLVTLILVGGPLFAAVTSPLTARAAEPEPIAPIEAPFAMATPRRPSFPGRVVDIRDHGAQPGGDVSNTAAIARAIKACAAAGGGRVLVPAGRWLTGPIHLASNIELHLAADAHLVFSDRFEDYLPPVLVRVGGVELYNYSPLIYARDAQNVAITGPGRLDGNARAWWAWKGKETREFFAMAARGVPVEQRVFGSPEAAIRPNFVVLWNCQNVLLEGFTIGGGPNWTIHPIYCDNVIIRRVHVLTDGPNNDGIDPDSCRNVLVEHCVFDTGDDCVVLKSGYNEDGWRVGRPTENVVMRWCSSRRGHGGLVIGSEMSGDVRNVFVYDCDFAGTDRAVRIKSRRDRGGVVENVWAENLRVRDMQHEVVIIALDYTADPNRADPGHPPRVRKIHLRNITAAGAPVAIRLTGLPDAPIEDVTFEQVSIAAEQGVIARHVRGLAFIDSPITPARGPVYAFAQARDVVIRGVTSSPPAGAPLLFVEGAESRDIWIEATPAAANAISRGEGVAADAVRIRPAR